MRIHETRTELSPTDVIQLARSFFTLARTPYAASAEAEGEGFLKLHMEVGEIVIAALPRGDVTWVRGSASRGAHLLTRFLATLAAPQDAAQTTHRHGHHRTMAARVETFANPAHSSGNAPGPQAARAA